MVNLKAQKKEFQTLLLETYKTSDEFFQDSSSMEFLYEIDTLNEQHYIFVKKKLNPISKKKDREKHYGFKYKGRKYFNLFWSENQNQHVYVPLDMEGFFSLILMPTDKLDLFIPNAYSSGVLGSLILEPKMRSEWNDKNDKVYYIMILEPSIKGSSYAPRGRVSDLDAYGVYLSNVSIKRYNKRFGLNLEKHKTTVEDWIDVVNKLNKLHDSGKLDYSQEQKEAKIKRTQSDYQNPDSNDKKKEYVPVTQRGSQNSDAKDKKEEYVPITQRSKN